MICFLVAVIIMFILIFRKLSRQRLVELVEEPAASKKDNFNFDVRLPESKIRIEK